MATTDATDKPTPAPKKQKAKPDDVVITLEKLVDERVARFAENGFTPEPRVPLVYSIIRNVMRDIQPIAKEHLHERQQFTFRRIDEILDVLQPLLVDHGLFYTGDVLEEREIERPVHLATGEQWVQIFTKVKVRYTMHAALDGSSLVVGTTMGEGMSEMQFSTAAAQTMAEKTMLCDVFCIPVHGEDDPEEMTGERSQPQTYGMPEPRPVTPTPAANDGLLFDDFTPPEESAPTEGKRKRTRKNQEPQVSSVGGATLPEETDTHPADAAPIVETPLSEKFVSLLKLRLGAKSLPEQTLFERFQVTGFESLYPSQMNELMAFIEGA